MVRILFAVALTALAAARPVAAAVCDTSKAPPVPVVKGLPYKTARPAIVSAGWQPTQGQPHNDLSSNETTFREQGYRELEFCRMNADSLCRFVFTSPAGVLLQVTTTGDENPLLESQAIVKAAKLTCAGESEQE